MGVYTFQQAHEMRRKIAMLLGKLPPSLRHETEVDFLRSASCPTTMDIVEIIYRPATPQGAFKDFEFSHATMRARWEQGLADARRSVAEEPWLQPAPPDVGVRTFDAGMKRGTPAPAPAACGARI